MVQNLFLESFKLPPQPSSTSNMEPFGCCRTGEREVAEKGQGWHSQHQQPTLSLHFATFLFSRWWEAEDNVIASEFWTSLLSSSGQLSGFGTFCGLQLSHLSLKNERKSPAASTALPYRSNHCWKPLSISKRLTTAPSQAVESHVHIQYNQRLTLITNYLKHLKCVCHEEAAFNLLF